MRFLVLSLMLLLPTQVYALSDIDDYQYKSAIDLLESRGIVDGYDDGTFRPNRPINRAEFLKLLMLSVYGGQAYQAPSARCFTDFNGTYQWFWPHACAAKQLGVVHGHPDGTFRGEDTIILAEALKMSLEAWGVTLEPDDPQKPWYDRYMREAANRNIFHRFPYTPSYQLTRGEMAQLLVMIGEPIAVLDPNMQIPDPTEVVVPNPLVPSVCGNGVVEGKEQCDDGNTENGDGCSKICVIVAEPVRHGALRVEQQVISNTPQTSGNRDVPFIAFTAIAGRQDVYITTLKFKSTVGSLQYAKNYRLFIDRDGNSKVETLFGRATADGETITFSNLNILVQDGAYMRIELWGDLDTALTPGSLAIGFDTTQSDFVEGVDKIDGEEVSGIILNDGTCTQEAICWITVLTSGDQEVTIRAQGNLYITQASTPLGSRQVVAGGQTPTLMYVNFRSDAENVVVKDFAIEGIPSSVDKLLLQQVGNSNTFATLKKVSCSSVTAGRFCADKDFTISQNSDEDIAVKAVLLSDTEGAVSDQDLTLIISSVTSGNVAATAQGFYSGQQLLQNDGNATAEGEIFIGTASAAANSTILSSTHTILFAKIVDISNSNPDPDNSAIGTGPTTFAQYEFKAANHTNAKDGLNSVDINTLVFTVSAVNMEFDQNGFYLYNTENSGTTHSCSANDTSGTITVTCAAMSAGAISTLISPGGTLNLALRGTITSAQVSPGTSVLQASLNSLSNPNVTGTVEWSDGENTFDWVEIGKTQVKSTVYRLD